jgi:HlyD family secretion protein
VRESIRGTDAIHQRLTTWRSMDRVIEKKPAQSRRASTIGLGIAALVVVGYLVTTSGNARLDVDAASTQRIAIAEVRRAEFQEYVPVSGTILPRTTVYLDLEEGGIVANIYAESGTFLRKGDLILSFSNSSVQKQNIETETRLLENLNQLRNSRMSLTQSGLALKDELLDVSYKIVDLEKTFNRYQRLMQDRSGQLSQEQFESTKEQLAYYKNKRALLEERIRLETALQQQQSAQIDWSIQRIDQNLQTLARIMSSLEVRAPIDGRLSTLSAEVGQSFQRGQRIGQIDQVDGFKVHAEVDQYYIAKVAAGQHGTFTFNGMRGELEVKKVYPEVKNGVFAVDMDFVGGIPESIKSGQTLQIDLSLSEAKLTSVVAKGSFYRHTNGRWAYVVTDDGRSAHRVRIVTGRQNPQDVEILEGLQPGDRIINSNYDQFDDVEELSFSQALPTRATGRKP